MMIPEDALANMITAFCKGRNCRTTCVLYKHKSIFYHGYCVCTNIHADNVDAHQELYAALLEEFRAHPEYIEKVKPEYRKYIITSAKII